MRRCSCFTRVIKNYIMAKVSQRLDRQLSFNLFIQDTLLICVEVYRSLVFFFLCFRSGHDKILAALDKLGYVELYCTSFPLFSPKSLSFSSPLFLSLSPSLTLFYLSLSPSPLLSLPPSLSISLSFLSLSPSFSFLFPLHSRLRFSFPSTSLSVFAAHVSH